MINIQDSKVPRWLLISMFYIISIDGLEKVLERSSKRRQRNMYAGKIRNMNKPTRVKLEIFIPPDVLDVVLEALYSVGVG